MKRLRRGTTVTVNNTSPGSEPGAPALFAGCVGEVIEGPTHTGGGTFYKVKLHDDPEDVADQVGLAVEEVNFKDNTFSFEGEQLDVIN